MAPTLWRQLWHRRHTKPFPPGPKGQSLGAPETSTAAMRELLTTAATREGRAWHPHEDHRASHRMLLAAALLRQGQDIGTVAAETHVPMALLELVRDELGHQATPPQHPRHPPHSQRRRSPRAWQRVAAVAVVEVAIANIVMSITALVWHSGSLGMLSGIVAFVLVLAVTLLSRLLSPTQHAVPPPNEPPKNAPP